MFDGYRESTIFIMIVLIIPFFETVIFQTLPISLINRIFKKQRVAFVTAILVSSFLFSIAHMHSLFYAIFLFYVGITLVIAFFVAITRNVNPTFFVFSIHSANNLVAYVINNY